MDLIPYRPEYVQYEQLLKQLHRLIAEDNCDTDEADSIRDRMEQLARRLTEEEQQRFEGLSGDLYMLDNAEVLIPADEREINLEWFEQALKNAWTKADWDHVIELLRVDVPFLREDHRAYLRARAYEGLGHLDTALHFMDHAAKLNRDDPSNPSYAMELLQAMECFDEARQRAEEWLANNDASSGVIIKASSVLFDLAGQMDSSEALTVYHKLNQALLRALSNYEDLSHLPQDVIALAYTILGYSYIEVNQPALGLAAFEQLSRIRPHDEEINKTIISMREQLKSVLPLLPSDLQSLPQSYDEEKLAIRDYQRAA